MSGIRSMLHVYFTGARRRLKNKRIGILTLCNTTGFRKVVGAKSSGSYIQTPRGAQSEWEEPTWIYQGQLMPDQH